MFFSKILFFFNALDEIFWGYFAFALIIALGFFLTIKSRFLQIRKLPEIFKLFFSYLKKSESSDQGIHPLKAFFASVGGMIGIGNVVGIASAVQIGGPGALLWIWFAGIIGAIVKYCEIYLGIKYRIPNAQGGFNGGPMYFLKQAFKAKWIPYVVAVLLCIYGVEIYQFSVITTTISTNWDLPVLAVMIPLLVLVLYSSIGGVKRIADFCSYVMPVFMVIYLLMALWVIAHHLPIIPQVLSNVFRSAFTGHAAIGGFAGSSMIIAIQQGISRAAYSADVGIGYDSIIQSETRIPDPYKQAKLSVLGVFIDNAVCTLSILLVLVTGMWTQKTTEASNLVQDVLASFFPGMPIFMPLFLSIVGFTTIIAFLCVGFKCAQFLAPKWGKPLYFFYAVSSFILFSFLNQQTALLVMSLSGASLLMINLSGMFRLRHQVLFEQQESLKNPSLAS